ncbi:MAG: hypothetical protein BGO86_06995 [Chryseobacterium sp. 36-9]|nr:MAG: hypothetical protein BGO86_06995 [Chryseobacterium sp. 36-9]
MKQIKMILLLFAALLISCTEGDTLTETDTGNNVTEKPYTIQGTVKDGAGNAIKSARIRVENPNGNNIHYTTTTDEAGKYSVTMSAIGGYKMYAWKEVTTENGTYQLRMGMEKDEDYDAFSVPASGIVKNFVWKLNGRIPDRTVSAQNGTGYFGGSVKFINYNSFADEMPSGTEVTITLTPASGAKYLDGTSAEGKIVQKKFIIASGVGQVYYINDIPATKYKITASSMKNGISQSVHLGIGNPDTFTPNAEYYFRPDGGSGNYENGLLSPNEYYFYIMNK